MKILHFCAFGEKIWNPSSNKSQNQADYYYVSFQLSTVLGRQHDPDVQGQRTVK